MVSSAKILFLLMVIFNFLSGCASKPTDPKEALKANMQVMREAVIKNVKDEYRRNRLVGLTKQLEIILVTYNQSYFDFAVAFGLLNRNYDTPRDTLEELFISFRDKREIAMDQVVRLHFDMVAQTTEDEWKSIVKHEVEAFKTVRDLPEDQLRDMS